VHGLDVELEVLAFGGLLLGRDLEGGARCLRVVLGVRGCGLFGAVGRLLGVRFCGVLGVVDVVAPLDVGGDGSAKQTPRAAMPSSAPL
jgi:hypothetical protein